MSTDVRAEIQTRVETFHQRYYSQLDGAQIIRFDRMDKDEDDFQPFDSGFPTFVVRLASGELIEIAISQDPEGNGGGHIFGLKHPDMSDFKKLY